MVILSETQKLRHKTLKRQDVRDQIFDGDEMIYQDQITGIPGNRHVAILSHVWLHERFRGKGIGARLHRERLRRARAQGFSVTLCTVRADNEPQMKILRKHGWKEIYTVSNTDSTVVLMARTMTGCEGRDEWIESGPEGGAA